MSNLVSQNSTTCATGAELAQKVAAVSPDWKWAPLDESTLAILVPSDQDPRMVSKEYFVSMLEYCEDLQMEQVIALFDRKDVDLSNTFAKTLRYIGFRALSPDNIPTPIDASAHFAMVYEI
ncbi:unnamed protein product, partial [Mesorhabditis spiculigera]